MKGRLEVLPPDSLYSPKEENHRIEKEKRGVGAGRSNKKRGERGEKRGPTRG